MRHGSPFAAEFDYTLHPQQDVDPLTGADLATYVKITLDGRQMQQKVFLTHLTCATVSDGEIRFPEMHAKSGKRYYGEDLHPALKMLLYSPAAVYWLRVPSSALADNAFLQAYAKYNNLSIRNQLRGASFQASGTDSGLPFLPFGIFDQPSVMLEFLNGYPPYHFLIKRYLRETAQDPQTVMQEWCEKYTTERRADLLRAIRHDAGVEAWRSSNIGNRFSVLAVHASSVLALAAEGKTDLKSIIDMATPLPQFMLGDVFSDGFGDDTPQLVEAMSAEKPDEYLRKKVRNLVSGKSTQELAAAIPARAVLRIQVNLCSDYQAKEATTGNR